MNVEPLGNPFWKELATELLRSFVCDTCGREGNCSEKTLPQKKGVNCWRPKGCLLIFDEVEL